MGILHRLGGRHRLLRNPVTRNLARAIIRANLVGIDHVSEAFHGIFRLSGCGLALRYDLGPDDCIGNILYWGGLRRFEPATLPIFIRFARSSRGVLDVGANVGIYSLLACAANCDSAVTAWRAGAIPGGSMPPECLSKRMAGPLQNPRIWGVRRIRGPEFFVSDDATMSSLYRAQAALLGALGNGRLAFVLNAWMMRSPQKNRSI